MRDGMQLVPVIGRSDRGERSFDICSRLLRRRTVSLNGEVDDASSALVCAQRLLLEAGNPEKPISSHIDSAPSPAAAAARRSSAPSTATTP